jgi:Tat protein secretion system quality control protein TatD with DNase activity
VIDSHTHLDRGPAPEAELVAEATDAGLERILTIGIDGPSRRAALAAAEAYEPVFAAIGHHPNGATTTRSPPSCASSPRTRAASRSARPGSTTTGTTRRAAIRSARSARRSSSRRSFASRW